MDGTFTTREPKPRLGELLVRSGHLTDDQLETALARQKTHKAPIGQVLVKLGFVTDDTMRLALSHQLGVPFVDLDEMAIDRNLGKLLNRNFARRNLIVPIAQSGSSLRVAMDDPTQSAIVDDLARTTGRTISIVTSSNQGIHRALRRVYEGDAEPDQVGRRADEIFEKILVRAIDSRCSDIHLEMLPTGLQIRFRVDGVLRQPEFGPLQQTLDRTMREVVSRIKILSKLDISERRRPQDGSFRFAIDRGGARAMVDLRVSIIPSTGGESVVVRILDRASAPSGLEALHLEPDMASRIARTLTRTAGIFLVTGPTGSGKSTTLHACLMRLRRPEIRILTVEDPVEYIYDGLSQSEVNAEIGNTFAAFLRAFLRHDPEVIMVGEIRDEETAEIAFRAAQTGHLLLSTLHTNTAIEALPRLQDLGVHPSLIAASLVGVMSQRLVRQVCDECRRPDQPSAELVREFFGESTPDVEFVRGAGCAACHHIGYRGRALVADLWIPDEHDHLLIMRKAPFEDVRASALRTTISMAEDAHSRLAAGQTTLEELARVLPYSAIADHRQRAERRNVT